MQDHERLGSVVRITTTPGQRPRSVSEERISNEVNGKHSVLRGCKKVHVNNPRMKLKLILRQARKGYTN